MRQQSQPRAFGSIDERRVAERYHRRREVRRGGLFRVTIEVLRGRVAKAFQSQRLPRWALACALPALAVDERR